MLTRIKNKLLGVTQPEKKIYHSYAEAIADCTQDAYQEKELIEVIFKKTLRFKNDLEAKPINMWVQPAYGIISLLPFIKQDVIKVLDFGGACGAHYFHTRKFIDNKLDWNVVETPAMVQQAKELENDELTFSDNLQQREVDLVFTSGTLQCVDDPFKYLRKLVALKARYIFFSRLALSTGKTLYEVHTSKLSWNGIGDLPEGYTDRDVKYPFVIPSEKEFLNELKDYSIEVKFDDRSGVPVGENLVGYGLLCRLTT